MSRQQIVETFHPGHSGKREGPFRTLRKGKLSTSGASVVIRKDGKARGSVSLFSSLNTDAAWLARHGHRREARVVAEAAAKIEDSRPFQRIVQALTGRSSEVVERVLEGDAESGLELVVSSALRDLARRTSRVRAQLASHQFDLQQTLVGRVAEVVAEGLVVSMPGGHRTLVPRWLGERAHRQAVGDLLAVVVDRLDGAAALYRGLPAIALEATVRVERSPFLRDPEPYRLTGRSAALLAGEPQPLRILVPVTIEE